MSALVGVVSPVIALAACGGAAVLRPRAVRALRDAQVDNLRAHAENLALRLRLAARSASLPPDHRRLQQWLGCVERVRGLGHGPWPADLRDLLPPTVLELPDGDATSVPQPRRAELVGAMAGGPPLAVGLAVIASDPLAPAYPSCAITGADPADAVFEPFHPDLLHLLRSYATVMLRARERRRVLSRLDEHARTLAAPAVPPSPQVAPRAAVRPPARAGASLVLATALAGAVGLGAAQLMRTSVAVGAPAGAELAAVQGHAPSSVAAHGKGQAAPTGVLRFNGPGSVVAAGAVPGAGAPPHISSKAITSTKAASARHHTPTATTHGAVPATPRRPASSPSASAGLKPPVGNAPSAPGPLSPAAPVAP